MVLSCRFHRLLTWLCACAVLFASLAPAVSQAMAVTRGVDSGLTPICTHSGLKWVDATTGEVKDAPVEAGLSAHLERCPFCASQTPALPVTGAASQVPPSALGDEVPFLFTHAPRPLSIWSRALSRGPPPLA